jgi:sulfatase modifying factor 1
MGCDTGRDEERPVHEVWVDAFEIAVLQVTNREYAAFAEATGHALPPYWHDPALHHEDQPVVAVSHFDAVAYAQWLSSASGRRYRLPSEAEWEKAARSGQPGGLYTWGDEPPQSRPDYLRRWSGTVAGPLPVGTGVPTAWGIYDLGENVHEWCLDWFHKDYYAQSPARNPCGPDAGSRRASRGGSWRHHIKVSRCAARSSIPPSFQYADYGFRLVREIG